MLNLVNCLNQMGNEFGGLSYHHFFGFGVVAKWVCTIIMLDFVDSCVGDLMTYMVFSSILVWPCFWNWLILCEN